MQGNSEAAGNTVSDGWEQGVFLRTSFGVITIKQAGAGVRIVYPDGTTSAPCLDLASAKAIALRFCRGPLTTAQELQREEEKGQHDNAKARSE